MTKKKPSMQERSEYVRILIPQLEALVRQNKIFKPTFRRKQIHIETEFRMYGTTPELGKDASLVIGKMIYLMDIRPVLVNLKDVRDLIAHIKEDLAEWDSIIAEGVKIMRKNGDPKVSRDLYNRISMNRKMVKPATFHPRLVQRAA